MVQFFAHQGLLHTTFTLGMSYWLADRTFFSLSRQRSRPKGRLRFFAPSYYIIAPPEQARQSFLCETPI